MKKLFLSVAVVSIVFTGILLPTSYLKAQVELPFAGIVSFPFPCTCSLTLGIWFTPLYLGGPVVATGPLVYSPYSTIPLGNFLIGVPDTWHIGAYIPGVQACWMIAVPTCIPFPVFGIMTKFGTSGPIL